MKHTDIYCNFHELKFTIDTVVISKQDLKNYKLVTKQENIDIKGTFSFKCINYQEGRFVKI